ncbi:Kazal-type serine protease inhibitor domain protein [Teladorsagia circumcincta]|uniref:Kazal-type serine protease inhibitor domain protein n=1 Tax=Teladorsagia circumcincta TaxID=45464 RepID=A0A2G9TYS2_TELCI|nr:Kazal-type serine protease inhibitor domain protein [Teladorsagia circumcincta]
MFIKREAGKCQECLATPCPSPAANASDDHFVCDEDGYTRTLGRCCELDLSCDGEKSLPVCGSDGRTYANKCALAMEDCQNLKLQLPAIRVARLGACEETGGSIVVVSSDSREEIENMDRSAEEITAIGNKHAERMGNCPNSCENTYAPVCGSDDITYTNMCHLRLAQCRQTISMCCAASPALSACEKNFFCPDRRFIPYEAPNLCFFGKERCIVEKITGKNITIQKFDVCDENKCDKECPMTYKPGLCCSRQCEEQYVPICDGNRTHRNLCEFKIAQCEAERHGQVLTLAYAGECCLTPKGKCESTGPCCANDCDGVPDEPVCDQHGNVYRSRCHFRFKACERRRR